MGVAFPRCYPNLDLNGGYFSYAADFVLQSAITAAAYNRTMELEGTDMEIIIRSQQTIAIATKIEDGLGAGGVFPLRIVCACLWHNVAFTKLRTS